VVKESPKIPGINQEKDEENFPKINEGNEKKNEDSKNAKRELEEKLAAATKEMDGLKRENMNNLNEIIRLNEYVKTLEENIKKSDEEINKLSYVNTTLKTNLQMFREKSQKIGEEKHILVKNNNDLKEEVIKNCHLIEKIGEEKHILVKNNNDLKEEVIKNCHLIEDLQKTIDQNKKDNKILQGVREEKTQEILSLKEEEDRLKKHNSNEILKLKAEIAKYQETITEWRTHYDNIINERDKLKQTKSEIEETMKRIDELTTKNMTYSNEINRLNDVAIENKKEKKRLEDENDFVKKDNMKIREEKSGLKEEKANLMKINEDSFNEIKSQNISIELLRKRIEENNKEIDSYKIDINLKTYEIRNLKEEIRIKNEQLEQKQRENKSINQKLEDAQRNIAKFFQDITNLNKAFKDKTQECDNNKLRNDQLTNEKNNIIQFANKIQQDLNIKEDQVINCQNRIQEIDLANKMFDQKVKKLDQDLSKTTQQLIENQDIIQQIIREKNALHQSFIELTNEFTKHQHFIDFLKKEHLVYKGFQERKFNDLTIQIEAMEKFYISSINALKKEISKLNQDIENLNKEIENQRNQYEEAQKKLIKIDKEFHQLETINDANLNKMKTLELEKSSNLGKIQGLYNENNDLESQLSNLKEKYQEKREEIKSLNSNIKSLEKEIKSLQEDNELLKSNIKSLNKSLNQKLEESESQVSSLSQKVEESESLVSSLEKKLKKTSLELNRIKYRLNLVPTNPDQESKKKTSKKSQKSMNSNPYDLILNIDSLKTTSYKNGWEITDFTSPAQKEESHTIVGIVGRENIGKTFILNKLCGFDLPSGTNVNTKGLSLKYSLQDGGLLCLDSAGIQTPVYYYDNKLMERFGTNKEDLKKNEETRRQMINDRTITDIFIQDFILEVAEVIIIVVGQLSQNDQKFIERIASKYKAKKRIIIIHNFSNLYSIEDVENKIKRDIIQAYDTQDRFIPKSDDVKEYIEKINDKNKENISHLVLGVEWTESGQKYNESTFRYLQDILSTRVDKKKFDLFSHLGEFLQDNYRLYLKFLKRLETPLVLKREKDKMYIKCDENFEISNPIFNSLGNLVSNPPFEVFEKKKKYIVLVEIPDLEKEPDLKFELKKNLNEFNNLLITGLKAFSNYKEQPLVSFRSSGEFKVLIPLGSKEIRVKLSKTQGFEYKNGVLMLEVEKLPMEEVEEL